MASEQEWQLLAAEKCWLPAAPRDALVYLHNPYPVQHPLPALATSSALDKPITLQRLKKRAHFLSMRQKASVVFMPSFVMQVASVALVSEQIDAENSCIIGFTVTKKVGNAVIRNRVRRRLKEAVRHSFPHHAKTGTVYVMIGTLATLTTPFPELVQHCSAALRKSPIPPEQLKLRRNHKHKKKG